jgi:hypothetical protein
VVCGTKLGATGGGAASAATGRSALGFAGGAASQTAPYAQHPPPRIEMPAAQQQAGGEAAEPSPPPRYRAHRRRVMQAAQVNRSVANGFTAELNRRELESLGSGSGTPPAETAPPPWRDLYPPR